jgi:hypothetical protein
MVSVYALEELVTLVNTNIMLTLSQQSKRVYISMTLRNRVIQSHKRSTDHNAYSHLWGYMLRYTNQLIALEESYGTTGRLGSYIE